MGRNGRFPRPAKSKNPKGFPGRAVSVCRTRFTALSRPNLDKILNAKAQSGKEAEKRLFLLFFAPFVFCAFALNFLVQRTSIVLVNDRPEISS
jgi:hypothetical protein